VADKRDYKKEYERDQKKRKKYRASLRKERVKRGLTKKSGYANGNGDKHIAHKKYAKGKAGGAVSVKSAKANLRDQPKRK
jgi:hypothetical protein